MLMVFVKVLQMQALPSAVTASKAKLRTSEFVFMRVNFLSNGIESAALQAGIGQREFDTRMADEYSRP